MIDMTPPPDLRMLKKVQRGEPDQDVRYEWQSAGGTNKPLYHGVAPRNSLTTAVVWWIEKYLFVAGPEAGQVPTLIQTRGPMQWANRANPAADGLPAWQ